MDPVIFNVRLAPPAADDASDEPKWVQVAREGSFDGYRGGAMPFKFTREHFDQVVANVHNNPAYEAGPDGVGVGNVIPWDFNHASEADPTMGMLPALGAPAQAWTLDMQVRNGADGKAELWALVKWLEPLKTYIREGKYCWASVALTFDATDPVTGANVGALVSSIAATNTPFIEGMQKLAATRDGVPDAALAADPTTIQTLIFDKKTFPTKGDVTAWITKTNKKNSSHSFKMGMRETGTSWRCAQRPAGDFKPGSFRTITLTKGVKAVIGKLKTQAVNTDDPDVLARHYYRGDMADSPEDAFEQVRDMLDLPKTSGVPDVVAQLAKLQAWAASPETAPPGVEVGELVGNLRCILNLPVMSGVDEVFAACAALLATIQAGGVGAPEDGKPAASPGITTSKRDDMNTKILASKLGVRETDDAIDVEIDGLIRLRDFIVKEIGAPTTVNATRLTEDVRVMLAEGASATDRLGALLKQLGIENPKDITDKVTDIMSKAGQLQQLMPELESLRGFKQEAEKEQVANDVQQAVASYYNGDDNAREMLELWHQQKGREAFLAKFPPRDPEEHATLTSKIAGGAAGNGGIAKPDERSGGGDVVDLSKYRGNKTQKVLAWCAQNVQGWDKKTYDEQMVHAFSIVDDKSIKLTGT